MKYLKKFVEDAVKAKNLTISNQIKAQAINALKVAGFDSNALATDRDIRRALKLVDRVLFPQKEENKAANITTGGRITTAAIVTAGQNCPRCGSKLMPISLGSSGDAGYYCTNSRCRVTCYCGD